MYKSVSASPGNKYNTEAPRNYIGVLMVRANYYLMEKKDLQKFLDSLTAKMDVYAPVKAKGRFNFSKIAKGQAVDITGYSNTEFPPKSLLLRISGHTLCPWVYQCHRS